MCVNAAYKASRLAVKYSPPTLFLEYTDTQHHTRVRAVKLSNISSATDLDYLTRKVIKGFPRGLDPSTVNTQQVKQLLQQLIDRSSYRQQLRRASSSRISRSSGHGEAVSHSTPEGAQTAGAACCAATTTSRRSSCHEQQQQQQAGAGAVSQQQHSTVQHACAISCSAPGPSSGKQQQQCNGATGHYHLQQQQHVHVPCAVSAVKQSLDTRLDAGHVSSVTTCSEQLEQKQQEQQHSEVSTSSVHTAVNSVKQLHSEDGLIASLVSIPAHLHTQSLAASGGGANAHGCSSSSSQSAAEAADDSEDDDGDCLVIEPKWVTPDGCEVDLNKVSDYELRLAKAQMNAAFQQNQLKPGDPGYEYDKQADFSPRHASNDWDDDE